MGLGRRDGTGAMTIHNHSEIGNLTDSELEKHLLLAERAIRKVHKDPAEMGAKAINDEIERWGKESSLVNERMIRDGRGHENWSETARKTDRLATLAIMIQARHLDLIYEVRRRAGPGMYRLPTGPRDSRMFGPRKR